MTAVRKLKIDVTSDVICPFCLLGMKQLELALDKYRSLHAEPLEVDIRLLPYQLNGLLTPEPMSRRAYGEKKFGAERWATIAANIKDKFRAVGLDVDTDGQTSSSHLAHRLQTYTLETKPEAQLPLAMDIFNSFHIDGVHPSDTDVLASLAVKHGVFPSEPEAKAWLHGTGCDLEVKKAYMSAQRLGVSGVPFFVFQDKYAASGAMGVDEFVGIFDEIFKREAPAGGVVGAGEQCPATVPTSAAPAVRV